MNACASRDSLEMENIAKRTTVKAAHLIPTVFVESVSVYLDSTSMAIDVLPLCMYLR